VSRPPEDAPERKSAENGPLSDALSRIQASTPPSERYRLEGEVARGGMGVIQRVWDESLRRAVARKILGKGPSGSDSRQSDPRSVGRFLEEAQVTAQLEHPGIVPVHELGLDGEGKLYFTMRLVKGEDLHRIFEHVRTGAQGWNVTRALHALLRVCEAMTFAHKKGVLHRDLKPANVMVGRFGEVYVMDWGLARILDAPDRKDVRLAPETRSTVHTYREDLEGGTHDSPLVTMDGDVVGTPAYMSPEQARGALEEIGPTSDVYAVGAMLYHLLAGHVPYVSPGRRASPHAIWRWVLDGPPAPLLRRAPGTPPELVAIVEHAMARERSARYDSMEALADDLRAYLELRVVRAHRTGAWIEFRKWILRNRLAATSLGLLVLVLAGAGFSLAQLEAARRTSLEHELARARVRELIERAPEVSRIHPGEVPRMEAWLADARAALAGRTGASQALAAFELRHEGAARIPVPYSAERDRLATRLADVRFAHVALEKFLNFHATGDAGVLEEAWRKDLANERAHAAANRSVLELEVPSFAQEIEALTTRLDRYPTWQYADAELAATHAELRAHITSLQVLSDGPQGLLARVEQRLELARTLARRTVDEAREAWRAAGAAIHASSLYGGLELQPQIGLVPLGADPHSGLWEFWHVLSGERPRPGVDGGWDVRPETGIVLVLVPGGRLRMGSQADDPRAENYFTPEPSDLPGYGRAWMWRRETVLEPYFLARHELTQGQWSRMASERPSRYWAGSSYEDTARIDRTHPVESVSWNDALRVLAEHGLELPTEARWELAMRAGTQHKYGSGATLDTVLPLARCKPQVAGSPWAYHAPVDALPPNDWGFQGMFGNVAEWCLDRYSSNCEAGALEAGTGEHLPQLSDGRVYRPGSFALDPMFLAASARHGLRPDLLQEDLGLRAARALDRAP